MTAPRHFHQAVAAAKAGIKPPVTPAHLRAAAALAIIDEYDDLPTNRQGGIRQRNHDAAIDRLAEAMHAIYGALPANSGWGPDRWGDRDDDIGDELADREERE